MELIKNSRDPFEGYIENLKQKAKKENKKINPIHEIVNMYYKWKGIDKNPKEFYTGRYGYGKLAREAKKIYLFYEENLDESLWALDQMKYKAEKGGFDWSIITCLKHKIKKDENKRI